MKKPPIARRLPWLRVVTVALLHLFNGPDVHCHRELAMLLGLIDSSTSSRYRTQLSGLRNKGDAPGKCVAPGRVSEPFQKITRR